jgi:hypothetical protein
MKPNLCCALNKDAKCPRCKLYFCMVCLTQEGHIKRKTWTLGVCVNTNQFVTIDGLEISEVLREEKSYV